MTTGNCALSYELPDTAADDRFLPMAGAVWIWTAGAGAKWHFAKRRW